MSCPAPEMCTTSLTTICWFCCCSCSIVQSCPALCDSMDCSTPGFPVHHQLLEPTQTHVHRVSDVIHPYDPLPSPSPSAGIFPSIRVFSSESVLCLRWPEYWSFSFRISPSKEYSELIFFRNDLVGSPCSPRDSQESSPTSQFKSIYSSVLSFLNSPTFCEMLSQHPYVTTGKIIALSRWTFVSKAVSLLFNMVSRLVIAFLSRGKYLLISGLQPPPAVFLEPKKIKSVTVSIVPIYLP